MTAKVKLVDLYFQFRVENNLDLILVLFSYSLIGQEICSTLL